ncbi:unnamed protein product [Chrysoparadoxa australica]
MEGYNGTIFAYGQTGCGKTHTMQGYQDPPELRGVIPNSFDHIFENVTAASEKTSFLVRCSYLEIYNEEIRDLLSDSPKQKLDLREGADKGVYVKDLQQVVVSDQEAINKVMEKGQANRTVGATSMNQTSSRSHSIFTIVVEMNDVDEAGKDHIRVGKLNLVDLAGSERQSKTGASGARLKEGCKINLSLSALGNVISSLVDGKGKHIPYRDSKLTRLLQDSLGGNTKTLMVAAISPADYNYDETMSTLRYANRAKNIKNKPKINEDPKDTMLREYKEEIARLREMLEKHQLGAEGSPVAAPVAGQQVGEFRPAPPKRRDSEPAGGNGDEDEETGIQHSESEAVMARADSSDVREVERIKHVEVEVERIVEVEVSLTHPIHALPRPQVIPEHVKEEKAAAENYARAMEDTADRLGKELEMQQGEALRERAAREDIASKLEALQHSVIGFASESGRRKRRKSADGAVGPEVDPEQASRLAPYMLNFHREQVPEEPEVMLARKTVEARKMQAKLRAKKRKEAKLLAETKRAEEEKIEMEKEMTDALGVAHEEKSKVVKKYKKQAKQLKQAMEEIEALRQENEREREQVMSTVREQNRELSLWEQVVSAILPAKEISRIWERAVYNELDETWELPPIKPRSSFALASHKLPCINGSDLPGSPLTDREQRKKEKRRGSSASKDRKGGKPPRMSSALDAEFRSVGIYETEDGGLQTPPISPSIVGEKEWGGHGGERGSSRQGGSRQSSGRKRESRRIEDEARPGTSKERRARKEERKKEKEARAVKKERGSGGKIDYRASDDFNYEIGDIVSGAPIAA